VTKLDETLQDTTFVLVHGISKQWRGSMQELVAEGIAEEGTSQLKLSERWRYSLLPLPEEKAELVVFNHEEWCGQWKLIRTIGRVFEVHWSDIPRRTRGFPELVRDVRWAGVFIRYGFVLASFSTALKFVSDIAAVGLSLVGLVAVVASACVFCLETALLFLLLSRGQVSQALSLVATVLVMLLAAVLLQWSLRRLTLSRHRLTPVDQAVIDKRTLPTSASAGYWRRFFLSYNRRRAALATIIQSGYNLVFVLAVIGLPSKLKHSSQWFAASLFTQAYLLTILGRRLLNSTSDRFRDLRIYFCEDPVHPDFEVRSRILERLKGELVRRAKDVDEAKGSAGSLVLFGHSLGGQLILESLVELAEDWTASRVPETRENAALVLRLVSRVVLVGAPVALIERLELIRRRSATEQRRRDLRNRLISGRWPDAPPGYIPPKVLNVWSVADPVSGPIRNDLFPVCNVRIRNQLWLVAHSSYFTARRFWSTVIPLL
jgi:hypothetical protein